MKICLIREHIFKTQMVSGVWLREQREKEEFGIGLLVRVLNHKGAKTQKGHKKKSVKIYQIREHIFLNTKKQRRKRDTKRNRANL